jgi:hypothetical protein
VADDPLGLGGIDLANLGPLPSAPVTSSLLSSPAARAPVRRRTKQDWRAIRAALMIGGGILGALVGVVVLLMLVPLAIQLFSGGYGSPEATFAAATQAAEQEDWRTFCACLTPPSRDALASSMIQSVSHLAAARSFASASGIGAGQAMDAKIQPILDVLQRYSLDDETVKRMASELPMMPTAADVARIDQALTPIRDRNGFVADMMAAMRQLRDGHGPTPFAARSELTDVKIDGDTARGLVVSGQDSHRGKQSITFQRSGGGWKIHAFDR